MKSLFRSEYRELTEAERGFVDHVKEKAAELEDAMLEAYRHSNRSDPTSPGPSCREHSIALTRLEESVMWAIKGLTA